MNFSDIYGSATGLGKKPNEVQNTTTGAASGTYKTGNQNAPAIYWVGFVGLLVLLRVVYEMGE